jgi:hypothetical protein
VGVRMATPSAVAMIPTGLVEALGLT